MPTLNEEDLKRHVQDRSTWIRFAYILVFFVAYYLAALLTFAVALFQFLSKLFSGTSFPGLADFGTSLALYQSQVTRYLTFASDEQPFPFTPFPCTSTPSALTPPPADGTNGAQKS